MLEGLTDARAGERLLDVAPVERLLPPRARRLGRRLGLVCRLLVALHAPPTGRVLDQLLEHGAEGLAGVGGAARRVAELDHLARDDEDRD
eukprot:5875843-Prymnesium_polylepis.1